jgi:hypothetical protein
MTDGRLVQIGSSNIISTYPLTSNVNQMKANLAGMVLGWSPFNIVSDSPAFHSKWLLLLKIEISFNCQLMLYCKSR